MDEDEIKRKLAKKEGIEIKNALGGAVGCYSWKVAIKVEFINYCLYFQMRHRHPDVMIIVMERMIVRGL